MKFSNQLLVTGLAVGALAMANSASAVLTHHWTFDTADTSGTGTFGDPYVIADSVGSADVSATGIDGGTSMMPSQPGVFGEAFSFTRDNTGDLGGNTVPGNPLDYENGVRTTVTGVAPTGSAERTIMLWFNQELSSGQNKLFGYGSNNSDSDGTTGEALDLSLEAGGLRIRNFNGNILYGENFEFFADDGAGTPGADAGWHHVALRVNAGASTFADIDIFLDGAKLDPVLVSGAADPDLADTLVTADSAFGIGSIGYDNFLNNNFTGLIDEVRIYDNALTNQEIAGLATVPGIPADLDGDGDVDGVDLSAFFSAFTGPNNGPSSNPAADLDGDGDVDGVDLSGAFSAFTGPIVTAAVPEPTSLALLGLGGLLVARRRR